MNNLRSMIKAGLQFSTCATLLGAFMVMALSCQLVMAQESPYDEAIQKDLQKAFTIAQTLFTDNPWGRLALSDLRNYGFRETEDVTVRILDGSKSRLRMEGEHSFSSGVFQVDQKGDVAFQGGKAKKSRSGRKTKRNRR